METQLVMTEQDEERADEQELPLLLAARAGNATAFEALVKRHAGMVLALVRQQLHDPHLAEDAAQEALLNAFRNLGQLQELEKFAPWLYRIAIREAGRQAQRQRTAAAPAELAASTPPPDPLVDERRRLVRQAVSELDEPYRIVVTLRYLEGLNAAEIGQRLKLPHGTVRARLSRATPLLREKLRRYL